MRTRSQTVTFAAPFTLPGLDRSYPAGTYRVTTDEEDLDVSFAATRRVATAILLVAGGETQSWPVDPADLEAALTRDARLTQAHPSTSQRP